MGGDGGGDRGGGKIDGVGEMGWREKDAHWHLILPTLTTD
jgi:hypothetical protein